MEQSIDDEAAKNFAGQLYGSIAFGLPLSKAFNQAVLQVRLVIGEDSGEPRLHVADGLDPDELYLVRPVTNRYLPSPATGSHGAQPAPAA